MSTTSFGTRINRVGEVEHLGNISIERIEAIAFQRSGSRLVEVVTGNDAREFWMLNGEELVQWRGRHWRGGYGGKFESLVVTVKP